MPYVVAFVQRHRVARRPLRQPRVASKESRCVELAFGQRLGELLLDVICRMGKLGEHVNRAVEQGIVRKGTVDWEHWPQNLIEVALPPLEPRAVRKVSMVWEPVRKDCVVEDDSVVKQGIASRPGTAILTDSHEVIEIARDGPARRRSHLPADDSTGLFTRKRASIPSYVIAISRGGMRQVRLRKSRSTLTKSGSPVTSEE